MERVNLKNKDGFISSFEVLTICLCWYTCSALQSITNKYALQHYPLPLTVALSSCLTNVLYAQLLMWLKNIPFVSLNNSYLIKRILPISVGRAVAITSAYFALWKVSVSYAQTVKATMPIFTVLIARFFLNERLPIRIYFSLMPIIFGIVLATTTEFEFDFLGLLSSLLSTGIFSFLNILAKQVFDETKMKPSNLLALNSQISSILIFPFWIVVDVMDIVYSPEKRLDLELLVCLFISSVCSFIQNLCAFSLIHRLHQLSYSVANTAKRVFVIFLSIITLKNPVTLLNLCGIIVSIFGVFIYNRAQSTYRNSTRNIQSSDGIDNEKEKRCLMTHVPSDISLE